MANYADQMEELSAVPFTVEHAGLHETKIKVSDYDPNLLNEFEITDVEQSLPFLQKPTVTWVCVEGLKDVDRINKLAESYGVHPLTVEDAINTEQHPKHDIFDDYIFISTKHFVYNIEQNKINSEQISIILGKNYVITFQEKPSAIFDSIRERLKNAKARIRKSKADYLAYVVMDVIVDDYFKVMESVGDAIEKMEEQLIFDPTPKTLHAIHSMRRETVFLRKTLWPMREIVGNLQRKTSPLINDSTIIYLKDVYDHIIQVLETAETYRDLIAGMIEVYMSVISNRMNDIMKVLTVFATIFIPLTFICSLYGMNFNTTKSPFNMPELNWYYGYPFALAIMAVIAVAMLLFFRRKKWI